MRQSCYTLGIIASQLIHTIEEEEKKEDDPEKKKEDKIDFTKIIMLQGGLESRFIPELSDKTKE